MHKRTKIQTDDPQATLAIELPAISLRERLEQQSQSPSPPPAPSAEMLQTLSTLPAALSETATEITRELERTAQSTTRQLRETVAEIGRRSETQGSDATQRLSELQRSLSEAERNLAYTVERLRRENGRAGWMQTGVVVLALLAGMLGGTSSANMILACIHS
jgi:hypothetical protein